jgi:phage terminase small subunit
VKAKRKKTAGKGGRKAGALTALARKFVREFMIDRCAYRAAVRAGYAETTAAVESHRWLPPAEAYEWNWDEPGDLEKLRKLSAVQLAVLEDDQRRLRRLRITAEELDDRLAAIANANIKDLVTWGPARVVRKRESGARSPEPGENNEKGIRLQVMPAVRLVESGRLSREDTAAVAEVSQGPNGVRIKLYDKIKAIELLYDRMGLKKPAKVDVEVSGPGGGAIPVGLMPLIEAATAEELEQLAMLAKGIRKRMTEAVEQLPVASGQLQNKREAIIDIQATHEG